MQHYTRFLLASGAGLPFVKAYTAINVDQFMNKNIDPIVYPKQYSKSHMHSFFGSDSVTINTTTSVELQAGCSTAENPNDYSVYWVPTLAYVNEESNGTTYTPVPVYRFSAYYKGLEKAEIPIPQDFKVVAGNSSATSQADLNDLAGLQWFCDIGGSGADSDKDTAAFPTETCEAHLQALLLFHDCVNEDTLESAYSGTQNWNDTFRPENRCPEGMSRMPQLRFSIRYDLRETIPDGWSGAPPLELSCGSSFCLHGDFINGWLPEAAQNMVDAGTYREFSRIDGPNGLGDAGSLCGAGNATDADPENGTSDYAEALEILDSATKKRAFGRRF